MIRMLLLVSSAALLVGAFGVSSGVGADAGPYALTSSVRCLNGAGGKVTAIRRTDRRRIALSDLSQRSSREVRFGRRSVLVAFARGRSEANFLREALVVPADSYVLRVKVNVVLMYRPADVDAFRRVVRCLRAAG
jgi:hypothetical protein